MRSFDEQCPATSTSTMFLLLTIALVGCQREVVHAPAALPDRIELRTPLPEAIVQSPFTVEGRARGPWFFEASFPVYLLDANGDTLVAIPAHATAEWMTEEFVPFTATVAFTPPASQTGTLVLAKDNPSGLPEHAAELRIPIRFR